MMNTNFEAGETSNSGDFTTANDFRKVMLLRDINSGGSAATATTLRNTKAILLTGSPGTFTVDEEINQATTGAVGKVCLLYTSPSPRDTERSRMPSSA